MQLNPLRFISAVTKDTIYTQVVKDMLLPGLEKFNLPYHIFEYDSLGDWKSNSRQRPLFIKEAMLKFPGENILWIDADAVINSYPEALFHIPLSCHLGVNYLDWSTHYGRPNDKDKFEILDGTSYYRNTPDMIPFMDEWIQRSVIAGKNHRLELGIMIDEKMDDDLNLFLIPREYCYIETRPNGLKPVKPLIKPIISHFQSSRIARVDLYGNKGKKA